MDEGVSNGASLVVLLIVKIIRVQRVGMSGRDTDRNEFRWVAKVTRL
jgi:hypothetical protein